MTDATFQLVILVAVILSSWITAGIGVHAITSPSTWLAWLVIALFDTLIFLRLGYEAFLWASVASTMAHMLVWLLIWLGAGIWLTRPPGGRKRRLLRKPSFLMHCNN